MKDIPADASASLCLSVTKAMTVRFQTLGKLHPVYATYRMAEHFEETSRKLLLPYLEPDEEGIGFAVSVEHHASALVGMRVKITARLEQLRGKWLHCALEASSELGDLIGTGTTVQVIRPKVRLEAGFAELERRWLDHRAVKSS